MKENLENHPQTKQRISNWKLPVTAAAILAVIQACLTIEGMGIEGFVLWTLILFVGYLLLFTVIGWIVRTLRNRT